MACLTRNSGILLFLRPCPQVRFMVKKAECKNEVGRYLAVFAKRQILGIPESRSGERLERRQI